MVHAYGLWSSSLSHAPFSLPRLDRQRFLSQQKNTRLAKRVVRAADSPDPPAGLCVSNWPAELQDKGPALTLHVAGADLARDFSKFVNETGAVTPLKTRR